MSTAVMVSDDVMEVVPAFPDGMKKDQSFSQFDLWTSIQESNKASATAAMVEDVSTPYVHPLLRRSSSCLSQKSLEVCTESLGSETGSDGFSFVDDHLFSESDTLDQTDEVGEEFCLEVEEELKKPLTAVNYHHCSMNYLSSPAKMYPPPLPSISRRDGPCVLMKQHRGDGRLVVHAVPVPSQNYLHCQREEGRLLLSFVDTTFKKIYPEIEDPVVIKQKQLAENLNSHKEEEQNDDDDEEEEEEEEEEVEVVDSLPNELLTGGMEDHRSSLVINKLVGSGTQALVDEPTKTNHPHIKRMKVRSQSGSSESTITDQVDCWGCGKQIHQDNNKFLFTSKKMKNTEDQLLHHVRRCCDYNVPLEARCITSAT